MKAIPLFLLSPALATLGLSSVRAQSAAPPTPPKIDHVAPKHVASLTLSPVHLVIGMVELTGEFRVGNKMGLAATFGGGQVTGVSVLEVGAQLAYYLTGDFDGGLHLGAEAQFLSALRDSQDAESMPSSASAEGLALGSMLGYKWVGNSGLSFVAQGGAQYMAVQAQADNGNATASATDSRIGALVNLNAGWSF